jgi:hypothetical protein
MAVNIDFVYQSVQMLANKSQISGYLSVDDFNRYSQISNLGLLDKLYAQYQSTSKITTELQDFLKKKQIYVNQYGRADFPTDFYYFDTMLAYDRESYLALRGSCAEGTYPTQLQYAALPQIPVKDTDHAVFGTLNLAPAYRPNYTVPRVRMFADYMQLNPIDIGSVELQYFKQPTTPTWGFLPDSFGLPVYNPATSTDFEWNITMQNELITQIASMFGIEIRDGDLAQATAALQASGI